MTSTLHDLQSYLGTLSATLWNYGATFAVPTVDTYDSGEVGFAFTAELPGPEAPKPAIINMAEIWAASGPDAFDRREYEYDFTEYPLDRRRAFHGHDPEHFAREFGVLVHEHCEEHLGSPDCGHYYGLPIDGFEAIRQFASHWGQPTDLDCASLRCLRSG